MSRPLKVRSQWSLLKVPFFILFSPFLLLGTLVIWLLFDISFKEAWKGELDH